MVVACFDTLQLVCNTLMIDTAYCAARYSIKRPIFCLVIPVEKLKVLSDTETNPSAVPLYCDVLTNLEAFSHPTADRSDEEGYRKNITYSADVDLC